MASTPSGGWHDADVKQCKTKYAYNMISASYLRCAFIMGVALVGALPDVPHAPQHLEHFSPRYHIPQNGWWMMDPAGNIELGGYYHVFPYPGWLHYSSRDLVHWDYIGNIDIAGSTGSSAVRQDGSIVVFARSENFIYMWVASDNASCTGPTCLNNFTKRELPVAIQPNTSVASAGYRDPSAPFRGPDGSFYMVVGAGTQSMHAQALLYQASDPSLTNFTLLGTMLSDNQTLAVGGSDGFFDMFECPDVFELGGYWVFISSAYTTPQSPSPQDPNPISQPYGFHNPVTWWIGTWNPKEMCGGAQESSQECPGLRVLSKGAIDWGIAGLYAVKSFVVAPQNQGTSINQSSRTRLLGGWVLDSSGSPGIHLCKDYTTPAPLDPNQAAWSQCPEALHREIWVCPNASNGGLPALCSRPAPQLEKLRLGRPALWSGVLGANSSSIKVSSGLQIEFHANISLEAVNHGDIVGVYVLGSQDGAEMTLVGFNATIQQVFVSRVNASTLPSSILGGWARKDTGKQGYGVRSDMHAPLPEAALEGQLRVTVMVDHSIIYVFANDAIAFTTRVYTSSAASSAAGLLTELSSSSNVRDIGIQASAAVWQLGLDV